MPCRRLRIYIICLQSLSHTSKRQVCMVFLSLWAKSALWHTSVMLMLTDVAFLMTVCLVTFLSSFANVHQLRHLLLEFKPFMTLTWLLNNYIVDILLLLKKFCRFNSVCTIHHNYFFFNHDIQQCSLLMSSAFFVEIYKNSLILSALFTPVPILQDHGAAACNYYRLAYDIWPAKILGLWGNGLEISNKWRVV